MFNMWPNIVVKVPMVVLVYCIGKILSCWSVGQQFYASTIWLGGHLGSVHRIPSPNFSSPPTIVYSSSELRLIRKTQPKQRLDPVLWGRLGDLGIRKRYRSKRGGWKLYLPRLTTGIPSPEELPPAPCNLTSSNLRIPSVLSTNVRSLRNKMDELQAVVDVNNPDIVCITESWLKPDIPDSTVRLSKYILFRRDRPTHAGGVCTYVNSDIPCLRVSEFEFPEIESIWIKARPHRLSRLVSMILIGTIYHPPVSCQEDNLRLLRHIQENVDQFLRDHPEGLVLVSGDFNPTSTGITELTTKRVTGLTQIIKVLTRDTGTLDWCLTNR